MTTRYYKKPAKLVGFLADRHVIMEASAGTGKTYTLEHLVVHLLIEEQMSIEEILVVTFTRRATAELKERVRKQITKMLDPKEGVAQIEAGEEARYWVLNERVCARLQEQLNQFDHAQIFTIHSFCQYLLTGHAFENLQLFSGELTDGNRLFEETYYEVLRSAYANDSELVRWLNAWFSVDGNAVKNILDVFSKIVRSQFALKPEFSEKEYEELLEAVEAGKSIDKFRLQTAVLHKFSDAIKAELVRKKLVEGMFTFDDMLQFVHDSLYSEDVERAEALVDALRARYKYALVDEFQDTDQVQWDIFKRIFLNSGNQNILCAIGDPKQAIYGFRGADVDTYFGALKEMENAGAFRIDLDENFRSSPEMIEAYNHIFTGGEFFKEPNRYPNPVSAGPCGPGSCHASIMTLEEGKKPVGKSAAIEILHLNTQEKINAGSMKTSFAMGIAKRIEEILGGKTHDIQGRYKEEDGKKAITAKDIFVLTRGHSESRLIGKVFRQLHIPYSFYREEGLFQTAEARHIYEVLAAACRPGDRSRRLRAYLTPFFGIPLELVAEYDELKPLNAGERTPHQHLQRWNQMANARQFRELFQALLEDSGILRRELVVSVGERALTNYLHLFEILLRQTAELPGTLDDLAGWFGRLIDKTDLPELEDGSLQRLESANDAVQVMTIHKSKGLQAKVVFVFGGFNAPNFSPLAYVEPGKEEDNPRPKNLCLSKAAKNNLFEDKAHQTKVIDNIKKFEREEAERLMYVALTRAEALMVLPYMAGKFSGDYGPVIDRLHTIVEEVGSLDPTWFAVRDCDLVENLDIIEVLESDNLVNLAIPKPVWPDSESEPTSEGFQKYKRLRDRHITMASYSSLSRGGRRAVDPEQVADGVPVEAPDVEEIRKKYDQEWVEALMETSKGESKIQGTKGGTLIHELFEFVDFEAVSKAKRLEGWASEETTKALIESVFKKNGYKNNEAGQEARQEAREMVFNTLRVSIKFPGGSEFRLADLERFEREMKFVFPIPEKGHPVISEGVNFEKGVQISRGFARGEIDLTFEHGGKTYFADWKSDRLAGGDFSQAALRKQVQEKYPAQAIIYTMATLRMLGIGKKKDFEEQFGGFFYFFARGMGQNRADPGWGVYFESVSWEQVVALEQQLRDADDDAWKGILQRGLDDIQVDVPADANV